jgi:serine protease Do
MNEKTTSSLRNGAVVLLLGVFFIIIGIFIGRNTSLNDSEIQISEAVETPVQDEEIVEAVSWKQETVENVSNESKASTGSEFQSPFVYVAEKLKPSVVSITVKREVGGALGYDNLREFFGLPENHPDTKRRVTTGGSGVIIDSRGHVVTNNHVITDAISIVVTLLDGEERTAELIGSDPETDLALLDIGEVDKKLVATLGNSDEIRIGDWAVAMGNPLDLDWTLTVGVISAKGRSDLLIAGGGPVFQDFIQTDASINFGNSGGPLTNIAGEVIGINSAVNTSAQGIGFAIPINMAKGVISELLENGYVRRGYLGMVPVELDPLKKEALGLDIDVDGVFVESVAEATPAERGGLLATDVISEINGLSVKDVADFRLRIAHNRPGEELNLTVIRNTKRQNLKFILEDRSEYVASANAGMSAGTQEWMGIDVTSLSSPMGRQMDLVVENGVLIDKVAPDSPADGKLQQGDVIVKVDKEEIESLSDWQRVTRELEDTEKAILVMYYRGGRGSTRFIALKR